MGIMREILLHGSRSKWLADQLTQREFTRRAVARFMPGEEMSAALDASESLRQKGMTTILTLLGENVTELEEADAVAQHYLGVLDRVSELKLDTDISTKPTHLGLDLGFDQTLQRYRTLVQRASELGRLVAIDMEDSSYVDRTIELFRQLRADHDNVVLCLQAYLYRTTSDLVTLLPLSPGIRLVKGAYNEPRNIAYRRKADVDESFLRLTNSLLDELVGNGGQAFFGTHDPRMISAVRQRAEKAGLPKDAYEFQMLYGIRRDAQAQLAADGYRVRVLISYGNAWFPWFMRRLAERPANLTFLARNLLRG